MRAVVAALVNEAISDGDAVRPDQIVRLGLLAFHDEEPSDEPLLARSELERFVCDLVADWAPH